MTRAARWRIGLGCWLLALAGVSTVVGLPAGRSSQSHREQPASYLTDQP